MKRLLLALCLAAALLTPVALRVASTNGQAGLHTPRGSQTVGASLLTTAASAVPPSASTNSPSDSVATGTSSSAAAAALQSLVPQPDADLQTQAAGRPAASSVHASRPALDIDELASRLARLATLTEVLAAVDMTDPAQRALAVARLSEIEEDRMNAVLARAEAEGIPLAVRKPDGRIARLYGFRSDGRPLYRVATNQNAAISSGAAQLPASPYSLTGSGMKVAVWDEGSIRSTHQELTGRITLKNASAALSDHSTHVAGTIAASGVQAAAKGMAPAATIDSYDWNDDYTEMSAAGAAAATDSARIPLSNHSYGYDGTAADMGRYETEARSVDGVAASMPYYLPCWAAGNEQDLYTSLGGYQSITFTSLAKNILTVGAVNDAVSGGVRTPSAGTMSYFSSWGPCDDGRIKPDLVSNGVGIYSSVSTGNTDYDSYDGTSMATPAALGSAALVEQIYKREFSGQLLRASLLKALLVHTADDLGTAGPDYKFGWGLINVKAAADLVLAHKASLASPKLVEGTLTNSVKTVTRTFTWDGSSPIRATLAWTDPAGAAQTAADSRVANLVHNLDLTVTSPGGTVYRPYVMPFVGTWTQASMALAATTGKNNVDNVEQVLIAAPTLAGDYTVTVTVDGTLTTSSQAFSVVVTGGTAVAANPAPNVTLTAPASGVSVLPGSGVNLAATATDTVVGGGAGVVSSVEFFVGNTSLGVDTSAPYSLTWTPTTSGNYSLTAVATDSEGASASSASVTVSVLAGDGTPAISGFTPASAAEGASVTLTGQNFVDVSTVNFNGVATSFTVSSLTEISASVPAGATSGAITVVTSRGTATSASSFTVELAPVLISQIYGGGGQTGATLNADYVELHNRGASTVSIAGWSVQYASASGTTWQSVALTGGISPGGYYLVKLAGGSNGSALPAPDATGSINMSATNGKVALRNIATAFSGSSPVGLDGLQDFVGYGTAASYEGSAAAPSPSTTKAIFRAGAGATDTGNNAADFTASAPNPRNSSGLVLAPVITSATSAGGTVGTVFSYQIIASNAPTAYAAAPLPAGLAINPATGVISGTPTAAGTTSTTLGATNSAGTGSATLAITITSSGGGGSGTVFSENMGTPSATTSIAANVFQNASLTFAGTADVRATTPSTGYAGASGGGDVFVTNTVERYFEISGINTTGYTGLQLSFGHYKSTTAANNELAVEVSPDGASYTALSYSRPTGSGTASWTLVTPTGTIPATANLRIRFRQTSSAAQFRIDDVKLTGSSAASPDITLAGPPAALFAIYGSASATPASFTVSATNLTAPVAIGAPAGFEISQTTGGASGYATSQSVGSSGALASTTLYVRLAAGSPVGSYSGDITATSASAQPRTLALAAAEIRAKSLTVTAQDRVKVFGDTLTPGTSAFATAGLVGSETVGAVTLTPSGGASANDAIGSYAITPSAATGGTFTASNYDITYQPGTLTVSGLDFTGWVGSGYPDAATAAAADADGDGLPNLMEFFLGLNPASTDANGSLIRLELVSGELRHEYRRNKAQNQYVGHIEWTDSLAAGQTWSSEGVTDELVTDFGDHELRRARVPLPAGVARRFLRLVVEPAPAP